MPLFPSFCSATFPGMAQVSLSLAGTSRAPPDVLSVHREIRQIPWALSALEVTPVYIQHRNAM